MKEIFPFFFANANIIEGAEAHSPGHPPWVKVSQIPMRPVRAKALIINAFALAGRFAIFTPYTQGECLGLCAFWALPFRYAPVTVGSARFV